MTRAPRQLRRRKMGQILDKLKGKAKRLQSKFTGDEAKKAEGRLDELKGDIKEKIEDIKRPPPR
jgi:uncharacterized protein YjbJ (UPF0337 family)